MPNEKKRNNKYNKRRKRKRGIIVLLVPGFAVGLGVQGSDDGGEQVADRLVVSLGA